MISTYDTLLSYMMILIMLACQLKQLVPSEYDNTASVRARSDRSLIKNWLCLREPIRPSHAVFMDVIKGCKRPGDKVLDAEALEA